jgi:nicotinamide riboside kinase
VAHRPSREKGAMTRPLRVVVFGPESTGKTFLTEALALRWGEPWSREYVRAYWDDHGGRIGLEDLPTIAHGQISAEDAAAAAARRIVFHDTDLATHVLWTDLLYPGVCDASVRREAGLRVEATDLFLFCETDLPFEPDPQRCFPDPDARSRARDRWRAVAAGFGRPVETVTGMGSLRLERAVAAVDRLLARVAGSG